MVTLEEVAEVESSSSHHGEFVDKKRAPCLCASPCDPSSAVPWPYVPEAVGCLTLDCEPVDLHYEQ